MSSIQPQNKTHHRNEMLVDLWISLVMCAVLSLVQNLLGGLHPGWHMNASPKAASVCKSWLAGGASEVLLCYFLFRGQNFHRIKLRCRMVVQVQSCFSSPGIDKSTSLGLLWVTDPYGWWQVQAHPPLKWLILLSRRVLTGWATMLSRIGSSTTMKGLEIFHYTVQHELLMYDLFW